ncbi:TrgA family protein [Aliiroseovarius subalbicans]|uniref:TrgA family protein n=1 Tax=Aliiroseovarius subalbicans TaxID=2925840 RepID=UPI001F5AAF84|nr:TrgA family protein [Aliiroseovarius subalbicans]MCI2398524.1 TrgA family protein [Aliiroseovarius subalbicans]
MPTAPKLVAAVFFAALGWFCADLVKPLLPDGTQIGLFSPISAGFGLLVGWVFTGKRLGLGQGTPIGIGFSSSILMVLWVLLCFSGYEMLRLALRKSYDGPVEAIQGMFQIGVDYLLLAATVEVAGALVLGGVLGGVLTGWAARRWS